MSDLAFDAARFDLDRIHGWLAASYWSPDIPRDIVARAIDGSLCVGAFDEEGVQIGFARLVTDRATFAYLADVIVDESRRGEGVGRAMVAALMAHPDAQGLRRWLLATVDAHGVYAALGWQPLAHPERFMEIVDWEVYLR